MICNYEVIKPLTNKSAPFLFSNGVFCVPNIGKKYTRYVECKRYNGEDYNYYLLLSDKDFDDKCYHCRVDWYGRLLATVHNELLEYCKNVMYVAGNISFKYIESNSDYDVWQIK